MELVLLMLVLLALGVSNSQCQSPNGREETVPPLLIDEEPAVYRHVYFKDGDRVELPCVATGQPRPAYQWTRNYREFSPIDAGGRRSLQPGVGTLVFARTFERDEGIYQCIAQNPAGVAVGAIVELLPAGMFPFPASNIQYHYPSLGHSFTLNCTPPQSLPRADIFWATIAEGEKMTTVDLDYRITMDLEGNLHFANVWPVDYQNGRRYTCVARNNITKTTQHGNYAVINPQDQGDDVLPPSLMWHSPAHLVVLRGDTLRAKCIFSGKPSPRVNWGRLDGDMPPRWRLRSYGQELVIDDVQLDAAGKYECRGINNQTQTAIRRSFDLTVEAAPFWITRPKSVNVSELETAVIQCEAGGSPDPVIFWYLNHVSLSNVKHNPRRIAERDKITFRNVTKDDTVVVQCYARNKHSKILQNAYINVKDDSKLFGSTTAPTDSSTDSSSSSSSYNTVLTSFIIHLAFFSWINLSLSVVFLAGLI